MIGTVAVLDANVLYPARLRNLLLRLADADLFSPRWSAMIHTEWMRAHLRTSLTLTPPDLGGLRDLMDAAFPQATVEGFEPLIDKLMLRDLDDRHVLAAAIRGQAGVIVTRNLKDFPARRLARHGVIPIGPDAFIASIFAEAPVEAAAAARAHRLSLSLRPKDTHAYLTGLRRENLPRTVKALRDLLPEI